MVQCEDKKCEEEVRRRVLCYHCGLYVCRWCWHHVHGCEPGHRKEDCRSLKAYRQQGQALIKRLRAQQQHEGPGIEPGPRIS